MKQQRQDAAPARQSTQREPVILFTISNALFGIAAASIHEIRSTDSLSGTAAELENSPISKVTHIFERGGKLFYVIRGSEHFGLKTTRPGIILMIRAARVAVLADSIQNMSEIHELYPLPAAFQCEEREWYRGLAYLQDRVIPIVNPNGFLTAEELRRLDATSQSLAVETAKE